MDGGVETTGDDSRGSGMRGLLLWSGKGTPLVNCWLSSTQGDDRALVLSQSTIVVTNPSNPPAAAGHTDTTQEASEKTQEESLMRAIAASSQLAVGGGGVGVTTGDDQQHAPDETTRHCKMALSMPKLGSLLTALKHFQDRAPTTSSSGSDTGGDTTHINHYALRPSAVPATLQLNVPIAVQCDARPDSSKEEGEEVQTTTQYCYVPINAAVVFGDRSMLCALDVFDPSESRTQTSAPEPPQSVMQRGNNRICDGRNLVTMLAFNALMSLPVASTVGPLEGGTTTSSSATLSNNTVNAGSTTNSTRGGLNSILDKVLSEQIIIDAQERKEENFNTKEIMADDAATDATTQFTHFPKTLPRLKEVGVHSFLVTVQSFVTELIREQKGVPGLYFLQGRYSVPNQVSAVTASLPGRSKESGERNVNKGQSRDDKQTKKTNPRGGGGVPERPVAPWDEQGDPSTVGVNASGWFISEGIQRKHSAFVVAGTHESPQGKSKLAAAALEACMLVMRREVVERQRNRQRKSSGRRKQDKSVSNEGGGFSTIIGKSNPDTSCTTTGVYVTELEDAVGNTHYVTWAARMKPVAKESDLHLMVGPQAGKGKADEPGDGGDVAYDTLYTFVDLPDFDGIQHGGNSQQAEEGGKTNGATLPCCSTDLLLPFFEVKTSRIPDGGGGGSLLGSPDNHEGASSSWPPDITGSGLMIASLAAMLDAL